MIETKWAVVGAGPAGIASIGYLLDYGIHPEQIIWIDSDFSGGDISAKWLEVPSNTKVGLFHQFFKQCKSFEIDKMPDFPLLQLPKADTCLLKYLVEPLRWIIKRFAQKIQTIRDKCVSIQTNNMQWQLNLASGQAIVADKVILAIGAEAKAKLYEHPQEISLEQALNPTILESLILPQDTVAVFGSSHSAILAIKNLVEIGVKQVINFYRQPLRYAVYHQDWILYDNTGLKGTAAVWAKENIDNNLTNKLQRLESTTANIEMYLSQANKAIYAIGFNRRQILLNNHMINTYDNQTGMIAKNLYGIGIAFPEQVTDREGNKEFNVGLWKFMRFLENNIESWIHQ